MIRGKELIHALKILSKNFYKIIEVNLDDKTYFEVKVEDEEPTIYKDVTYWAAAFAVEGVHKQDRGRFREFFQPFKLKERVTADKWQRVYYRRKIDGDWRWVCMEVIPSDNYSADDPIVLIVVRDVQDYIRDFESQITVTEIEE